MSWTDKKSVCKAFYYWNLSNCNVESSEYITYTTVLNGPPSAFIWKHHRAESPPSCAWHRSVDTELPSGACRRYPEEEVSRAEEIVYTYVESIYADCEGQNENVPSSAEPSHGVTDEDESKEPEEWPDGVATTRPKSSTCCHLESGPETENQTQSISNWSWLWTVHRASVWVRVA